MVSDIRWGGGSQNVRPLDKGGPLYIQNPTPPHDHFLLHPDLISPGPLQRFPNWSPYPSHILAILKKIARVNLINHKLCHYSKSFMATHLTSELKPKSLQQPRRPSMNWPCLPAFNSLTFSPTTSFLPLSSRHTGLLAIAEQGPWRPCLRALAHFIPSIWNPHTSFKFSHKWHFFWETFPWWSYLKSNTSQNPLLMFLHSIYHHLTQYTIHLFILTLPGLFPLQCELHKGRNYV